MTAAELSSSDGIFRDRYDGLLADLDGVVYVGPAAVPNAVEALNAARAAGLGVGYVTNNANRPPDTVVEHLRELGIELTDADVVTSAQIGAKLLRERFPAGSAVLAVGGPGVTLALQAEDLLPVQSIDDSPVAVMQGYGPEVGWRQLAEAAFAVQRGAHWLATNTDLTIPQANGIAPGNGTLVAAVRAAVGVDPQIAGKPQAVSFTAAAERIGSERPLVLGDRLDTDIEGANAAGFDSLLVLTGVHGFRELAVAPADQRPTYISTDLGALTAPMADVVRSDSDDEARCASARVELEGEWVRLRSDRETTDAVDALRATLELIWAAAARGTIVAPETALLELVTSAHVGADR